MAYEKLNLKDGDVLKGEHLEHIENALYNISIGGNGSGKNVKLCLPKIIRWETNKPLYIFKHAITTAFNYQMYNILVLMSTNETKGKDRNRYFTYTPTEAETNVLTFNLYDNAQNLIDTKQVTLKVVTSGTPSESTNVLFIGDSLVYYNRITDEFYRILTSSDTATTVDDTISIYKVYKPAGRKSSNVTLIGTLKLNYKGWTGLTKHEGRSGWGWNNFNSTSSPFYNSSTKTLDFNNYFTKNNFATPDVIYIGLGWNDTRLITISDTSLDISPLKAQAKAFLDKLTEQLPNTKIRLWTLNIPGIYGGIGNHVYGATAWSDEHRLKLMMLAIAEMYQELASTYENVEVVWTTCMIDSEHALLESKSAINYRITDTEILGVDYVHPADSGFFQIADGIVSDFMHCINGNVSGEGVDYSNVEATAINHYTSPKGNAVMYYQDVFKYFNNTTLSNLGAQIVIADVSLYVDKQIKITAATSVASGASYAMFTSKLPTGLNSLADLSSFNASGYEEDKTDMVEYFNISNTDKVTRTILMTVPQGTTYLTFTNLSNYCTSPFVGVVTE